MRVLCQWNAATSGVDHMCCWAVHVRNIQYWKGQTFCIQPNRKAYWEAIIWRDSTLLTMGGLYWWFVNCSVDTGALSLVLCVPLAWAGFLAISPGRLVSWWKERSTVFDEICFPSHITVLFAPNTIHWEGGHSRTGRRRWKQTAESVAAEKTA